MKTVGIIGGIGPESTIEYYRSIVRLYREQKPDGSYPSVIIISIGSAEDAVADRCPKTSPRPQNILLMK